jgi:hypothetical protein
MPPPQLVRLEESSGASEKRWIEIRYGEAELMLPEDADLYDRHIVAYVVSDRNDNPLGFTTFDRAVEANPGAHPLFHSDRGFQYTNRTFHHKLVKAGMKQSMSRVAKRIDNGPWYEILYGGAETNDPSDAGKTDLV